MPEPWKTAPLGDLCDNDRGITYGIVKVGDYIAGGVPVIRGGDIRNNRIIFSEEKRVSPQISNQFKRTILRGGEIVLNLIAEPGHSAVVPEVMKGFNVSRDVAVIPLNASVNHVFVNCFLKSSEAVSWLGSRLNGSVTQKINLGTLREVPVPIPPRWYQDTVAALLGALDNKIVVNDRIAGTGEKLATSIASDERWTARIPLGKLACHVRDQISPEILTSTVVAHYSLPAFDTGRLPEFTAPTSIKSSKFVVDGPCVLLSKLNPSIPRVWNVRPSSGTPALASTEFLVLKPSSDISPDALWAVCSQPSFTAELTNKVTGTSNSHQRVKPADLLATNVVDPHAIPEDERNLISSISGRVRQARSESVTLSELRDILLPRLMSGEIRVREAEEMVAEVT